MTTPADNTFLGDGALASNITGTEMVAVGFHASYKSVDAIKCTAIGHAAMEECLERNSTAVGAYALQNSTGGKNNTGVGAEVMRNITMGDNNTCVGRLAMSDATTANSSVAIGNNALEAGGANHCVGIGRRALRSNKAASATAVGRSAAEWNVNGLRNSSFGYQASRDNVAGNDNSSFGHNAILTGKGSGNTAVGSQTLDALDAGSRNLALGEHAGMWLNGNESDNILIAHVGASGDNNRTYIGTPGVHDVISIPRARARSPPVTPANDTYTISIDDILAGVLRRDMSSSSNWTLPSAALAVGGVTGAQVHDALDFYIINEHVGGGVNITLAPDSGVTLVGSAIILSATAPEALTSAHFRIQFTAVNSGSETYSCLRLA